MEKTAYISFKNIQEVPVKELFLNDKILIPNVAQILKQKYDEFYRKNYKPLELIADIEYLRKEGYIVSEITANDNDINNLVTKIRRNPELPASQIPDWVDNKMMSFIRDVTVEELLLLSDEGWKKEQIYDSFERSVGESYAMQFLPKHNEEDRKAFPVYNKLKSRPLRLEWVLSRLFTTYFENREVDDLVPILYKGQIPDGNSIANEVNVNLIVLSKILLPDKNTPLEDIIKFKKDPEVIHKLRQLRLWMYSVSTGNKKLKIVNEELEFLIHDYNKYMILQKAKFNQGILEFLVTTTAEAVENTMKFRLGNIAKSLFKLKYNKISLTEKEMKAPGREIAFISSVNEKFKKAAGNKR